MMADDQSALIEGALRYGTPSAGAAAAMYGIDARPTTTQPMYFHTESAIDPQQQRVFDTSTTGNSVRRIPYAGTLPTLADQQASAADANGNDSKKNRNALRLGLIVAALIFVAVLGIVLYFALANDQPTSDRKSFAAAPNRNNSEPLFGGANRTERGQSQQVAEEATTTASAFNQPSGTLLNESALDADPLGGVRIETEIDDVHEPATTYYYPSPMATPRSTPPPLPQDAYDPSMFALPSAVPVATSAMPVPRGSAGDGKPPPGSWFGADAPTRGETASEMALDGEFGNQAAVSKIYGGKANSVLGGKNRPPFATVNEDAARQIGWAEMGDPGVPEFGQIDANQIATGSARSMSELYQSGMEGRQFREGSSASTFVTPDQAAEAAIGNSPDRSQQFAEGRQRAKAITAESSAAIGSIYNKKRKAAAGLSAAAIAQQRQLNDTNFDYFDVQSQQPI